MTAQKAASTHYTPADVFHVTGVSVAKQNQWLDRRVIVPSRLDTRPNGSGVYRMVCAATVYQFAITAVCVPFGIPAKLAAEGARLLAVSQPGRQANELWEFGKTVLILTEAGASIRNLDSDASLNDIFGRPFAVAATIIDVGQIVKEVHEKLISAKKDSK
jgi:hypothetical protein